MFQSSIAPKNDRNIEVPQHPLRTAMFQSSIAPKNDRNVVLKRSSPIKAGVPILDRPEERSQLPSLWVSVAQSGMFQSSIAPKNDRNRFKS